MTKYYSVFGNHAKYLVRDFFSQEKNMKGSIHLSTEREFMSKIDVSPS